LVLAAAFTVSYYALLYPLISALAFGLSSGPRKQKVTGWAAGASLCFLFFCYTGYRYQLLSGRWQFAPYLSWLTANNGLIAYRKVPTDKYVTVPNKFTIVDSLARAYFTYPRLGQVTPKYEGYGTLYLNVDNGPLLKYKDSMFRKDRDVSSYADLRHWALMSFTYKDYGLYLIQQYPQYYFNEFIVINARKYLAPPPDYLDKYNSANEDVKPVAQNWFHYKGSLVYTRLNNNNTTILDFYPVLSGILILLFLLGMTYYFFLRGNQYERPFNKTIVLGMATWLSITLVTLCFFFTALRTQAFVLLISIIYVGLLVDWMFRLIKAAKLSLAAVQGIKGQELQTV
jgi:hypothetical protein